jgi:protein involved in polysaccharide export with SLBB domain
MKKPFLFVCLAFFVLAMPGYLVSQANTGSSGGLTGSSTDKNISIPGASAQTAMAAAYYPVTAGDVYELVYATGTGMVKYTMIVDSAYKVRVANLGIVEAAGKTYLQLKNQVETIVSNNYPLSGVQFVLAQPAAFRVYLRGEVVAAREVPVWALNRLSSILEPSVISPQASLRDISIQSAGGQVRVYDLFKATRFGDISQDPYLRPGDTITLNQTSRVVTIAGAVKRPGTYQLLAGENLRDLIDMYGGGFTDLADRTRVEVDRFVNGESIAGSKLFLTDEDILESFELQNYDAILVPENRQLQPVVFVEGAILSQANADLTVATKITVPFSQGEYYSTMVRKNRSWFSAVSDTRNAYIIRKDVRIPINLNPMLYDTSFHSEVLLQADDVLIIPFRQYFVTVAGAVLGPGRYPYIPDRQWDYYIALAGGFVPGRNSGAEISIVDINGQALQKTDAITPETIITAESNNPLYYFNQFAPVITTILTIISTTISILALIANR